MKNKVNNSVCYITCLCAGLIFGSCQDNNYEDDASLYKKEVPSTPGKIEIEKNATEGNGQDNPDERNTGNG